MTADALGAVAIIPAGSTIDSSGRSKESLLITTDETPLRRSGKRSQELVSKNDSTTSNTKLLFNNDEQDLLEDFLSTTTVQVLEDHDDFVQRCRTTLFRQNEDNHKVAIQGWFQKVDQSLGFASTSSNPNITFQKSTAKSSFSSTDSIPSSFSTDAGKKHLRAVKALLLLSSNNQNDALDFEAVKLTLSALRSVESSQEHLQSLLGTPALLRRVVEYHMSQIMARLQILLECIRRQQPQPESNDSNKRVSTPSEQILQKLDQDILVDSQPRGIFFQLLVLACGPPLTISRKTVLAVLPNISSSANDYNDSDYQVILPIWQSFWSHSIRPVALQGLLTLLYQRCTCLNPKELAVLVVALDSQDWFVRHNHSTTYTSTPAPTPLLMNGEETMMHKWSALLTVVACSLCSLPQTNTLLAQQQSSLLPNVLAMLEGMVSQNAIPRRTKLFSVQPTNTPIMIPVPESVALLALSLLLHLHPPSAMTTTAATTAAIGLANDCGVMEYLEAIFRGETDDEMITTSSSSLLSSRKFDWQISNPVPIFALTDGQVNDESDETTLPPEQVVELGIGLELLQAIVSVVAQFNNLSDNLNMLCPLAASLYRNRPILCREFWNEFEAYSVQQQGNSSPPNLLDAAYGVAVDALNQINSNSATMATRKVQVLRLVPLWQLIGAVCHHAASVDRIIEMIQPEFLTQSLQACASVESGLDVVANDQGKEFKRSANIILQAILELAKRNPVLIRDIVQPQDLQLVAHRPEIRQLMASFATHDPKWAILTAKVLSPEIASHDPCNLHVILHLIESMPQALLTGVTSERESTQYLEVITKGVMVGFQHLVTGKNGNGGDSVLSSLRSAGLALENLRKIRLLHPLGSVRGAATDNRATLLECMATSTYLGQAIAFYATKPVSHALQQELIRSQSDVQLLKRGTVGGYAQDTPWQSLIQPKAHPSAIKVELASLRIDQTTTSPLYMQEAAAAIHILTLWASEVEEIMHDNHGETKNDEFLMAASPARLLSSLSIAPPPSTSSKIPVPWPQVSNFDLLSALIPVDEEHKVLELIELMISQGCLHPNILTNLWNPQGILAEHLKTTLSDNAISTFPRSLLLLQILEAGIRMENDRDSGAVSPTPSSSSSGSLLNQILLENDRKLLKSLLGFVNKSVSSATDDTAVMTARLAVPVLKIFRWVLSGTTFPDISTQIRQNSGCFKDLQTLVSALLVDVSFDQDSKSFSNSLFQSSLRMELAALALDMLAFECARKKDIISTDIRTLPIQTLLRFDAAVIALSLRKFQEVSHSVSKYVTLVNIPNVLSSCHRIRQNWDETDIRGCAALIYSLHTPSVGNTAEEITHTIANLAASFCFTARQLELVQSFSNYTELSEVTLPVEEVVTELHTSISSIYDIQGSVGSSFLAAEVACLSVGLSRLLLYNPCNPKLLEKLSISMEKLFLATCTFFDGNSVLKTNIPPYLFSQQMENIRSDAYHNLLVACALTLSQSNSKVIPSSNFPVSSLIPAICRPLQNTQVTISCLQTSVSAISSIFLSKSFAESELFRADVVDEMVNYKLLDLFIHHSANLSKEVVSNMDKEGVATLESIYYFILLVVQKATESSSIINLLQRDTMLRLFTANSLMEKISFNLRSEADAPYRGYVKSSEGKDRGIERHEISAVFMTGNEDPAHPLWLTTIRIVVSLLRIKDFPSTIELVSAFMKHYGKTLFSCLHYCGQVIPTRSNLHNKSASVLTHNLLVECNEILVLAYELLGSKELRRQETIDEWCAVVVPLVRTLSSFLGAVGTSRQLFRLVRDYELANQDADEVIFSNEHTAFDSGLQNGRFEGIRYAHLARRFYAAVTAEEYEESSKGDDGTAPITSTDLERKCQTMIESVFNRKMERASATCLTNAINLILQVHPSSEAFLMLSPRELKHIDHLTLVQRDMIIAYYNDQMGISYGKVQHVDTIRKTLKVTLASDDKSECTIKMDQLAGWEDTSKRKCILRIRSAPDRSNDLEDSSPDTSVGHLILALRWSKESGDTPLTDAALALFKTEMSLQTLFLPEDAEIINLNKQASQFDS